MNAVGHQAIGKRPSLLARQEIAIERAIVLAEEQALAPGTALQ